MIKSYFRIVAY